MTWRGCMCLWILLGLNSTVHAQKSKTPITAASAELQSFLDSVLPTYEKSAAECLKELAKHATSSDAAVRAAANGARFRAELFLHARTNLQRDPKYLRYLTAGNLKLWQDGMEFFRDCARDETISPSGVASTR